MRKTLETITPLTDADLAVFDRMRRWLLAPLDDGHEFLYDSIRGKLLIVQAVLQAKRFGPHNVLELQALGVAFGDALAQQLDLTWMISDSIQFGRRPVLNLPGTSLAIGAFTAIQKRVVQGEPVDVRALFDAFCDSTERLIRPRRSLWGRLFGERLA
ncbi:DUF3806 domain-containing protein [Burkholderia sp. Ac-20353]|uniref:DUF3806 domain-containing protein n=1 Tax=Burkholderia sp. Ac-20353 TaxID=2703894 RepID=UPI00197C5134|nr:DUF3806 domain-containing protein [Burkholderia sp. Ac-20353]MBN3789235.1 DUF3806 domain-containing protein [Burkholderia sp. Ac-20353]